MSVIGDIFAGGAAGIFDGVSKIISNFKADPLEVARLEVAVEQAKMQYESQVQQAVNATMQAEAKSEHWLQWSWRPFGAYTFYFLVLHNYVLAPYFKLQALAVPDNVWLAFLALLGVAAYTRGQVQIAQAKANGNGK